jgi:hypothetical protein
MNSQPKEFTMKRFRFAITLIAVLLVTLFSVGSTQAPEPVFEAIDPEDFSQSTMIDNEWMPMQPGSKWVFEGSTNEDGEKIARHIEFVITDLTKTIEGVPTVVAWITDFADGELVESEIAFYAQDNEGTVWYFGEYPEEFENGEFIGAKPWIAGIMDAEAGIKMRAEPQADMSSYFQGWGPAVGWSDFAQVVEVGQETCVPFACYKDVLVIHESSLAEQEAFQIKHYARGVGDVRVGWTGDDTSKEELELIDFTQLSPDELAKVQAEVMALEEHAYEVSKDVYALTTPIEAP